MKRFALLLAGLMMATTLTACAPQQAASGTSGSPAAADPGKPYAGTTLRFVAGNHGWITSIEPLLPEFEEQTGITVELETYEINQCAEKVAIELSAQSPTLDVMFIRPMSEGMSSVENGWLEPLDEYWKDDEEFDVADIMPAALDAFTFDGKVYGAPICTERQLLYYRKDIFEENGIEVPTTLDEMYDVALQLNNPEEGFYGFVTRGTANVTAFASFLYSFGGQFQDGTTSTLNTPEAIAAIEYYGKILKDCGPNGILNMGWEEAAALFAQGKCAMISDVDALYLSIAAPVATDLHDQIGYAVFPAGPAGSRPINACSFGLSISAFSQNKEAAWEFIRWAVGKEVNAKIQANGSPTARISAWEDESLNENLPAELVEVINASFENSVGVDRPLTLNYPAVRDIIVPLLGESEQSGGQNIPELAEIANQEIQAIYDEYDK